MDQNNYLNISQSDKYKKIYRIFTIERLLQLIINRENVLVKPRKWDDPFENFILNGSVKDEYGIQGSFSMRNHIYGQCWSLRKESDAMWRIYAPDKNGVKIQSTIENVFSSLYKSIEDRFSFVCFIGKVDYVSIKKLEQKAREIDLLSTDGSGVAKSLLIKRIAFDHEKEVRLIFFDHTESNPTDIYKYKMDPFNFINSITFDPRMADDVYKTYKNIIRKLGYKGELIKSGLYEPPKKFIYSL